MKKKRARLSPSGQLSSSPASCSTELWCRSRLFSPQEARAKVKQKPPHADSMKGHSHGDDGGGGGVGQTKVQPVDARDSAAQLQTAAGLQRRKDRGVHRSQAAILGSSVRLDQTGPDQTRPDELLEKTHISSNPCSKSGFSFISRPHNL